MRYDTKNDRIFFVQEEAVNLTETRKNEIIETFKIHDTDTGSPDVQIALLTERIVNLTEHLKTHKKTITPGEGSSSWLENAAAFSHMLKARIRLATAASFPSLVSASKIA
jgi:hypothetical protein